MNLNSICSQITSQTNNPVSKSKPPTDLRNLDDIMTAIVSSSILTNRVTTTNISSEDELAALKVQLLEISVRLAINPQF